MELPSKKPEKIRLVEINSYLTCYLCKGYLIDATTISECLHSFCRSCIIQFLQENSYCPVCEVIINKAKPNLKLDKTLQDIVYKLVPELFLKEMTRRKTFYQQHPEISTKLTPEERGEDTERTIFNPQDLISLSLEYVRNDSVPGAIKLPEPIKICDKDKNSLMNLTDESTESQMKRYLQCPGMCRIEVLKKFVRNKYNVDTNLFYIDILYKRVPLPDHYTLIDIAYIYSWKRNEPMKFFFRITDINKTPEQFDFFTSPSFINYLPKPTTIRSNRNNSDKVSNKKRDGFAVTPNKKLCKISKLPSPNIKQKVCDNSGENSDNKTDKEHENGNVNTPVEVTTNVNSENCKKDRQKGVRFAETPPLIINSDLNVDDNKSVDNKINVECEQKDLIKSDPQQEKISSNNKVFTNITLNRSNNVEIITKIEKVSNKDGQEIGVNIFKQIKKGGNKNQGSVNNNGKVIVKANDLVKSSESKTNDQCELNANQETSASSSDTIEDEKSRFFKSIELTAKTTVQSPPIKQNEQIKPCGGQKRKNSSPVKNDKATKKVKINKTQSTKIILQSKNKVDQTHNNKQTNNLCKQDEPTTNKINSGLQSLITSCNINIPSSLSITIKDSNEPQSKVQIPPVQNYIEILKLPDENKDSNNETQNSKTDADNNENPTTKFAININETITSPKLSIEDSEQKVDEDLSEIAKSLTEKLPNVSQIIDPKPQFQLPNKNNTTTKLTLQPSPVPDLPCKVLNTTKDNIVKLNPRSSQTFQKIFEESIKKDNSGSPIDGATNSTNNNNNNKRNILEIAKQLYKKTKLEQEKNLTEQKKEDIVSIPTPAPVPKVPIPRLPHQRTLKQTQKIANLDNGLMFPQTVASLHSSSLGLNYTVSVGQSNMNQLQQIPKINGILSPVKTGPFPTKEPENDTILSTTPPSTLNNANKSDGKNVTISDNKTESFKPLNTNETALLSPTLASKRTELKIDLPSLDSKQISKNDQTKQKSITKNLSPGIGGHKSPKHSPKSSPVVKHMYSPTVDPARGFNVPKQLPSPTSTTSPSSNLLIKVSPNSLSPSASSPPKKSPKLSPKQSSTPSNISNKNNKQSPSPSSPLNSNQLLEKYNIQNLAQLTASLNFNAATFGLNPSSQLALQQAMLLKHIEMQNRQNWLNMNQGPLLQYEKFLQSLNSNQNQLLSNIKEN